MKKKPCPFCGSEKVVIDQSGLNREAYWPLCKTCGIVEYPTEQAAIEAWNRRTDPINKQMLEAYYRYRLEIKHLLSQQPKLKDYFSEATQVEVRLREPFEAIIKAAKEEEGDT